jgi:hypothetical protein
MIRRYSSPMTHGNDERKKREGLLSEAAEAKKNASKLIE